MAVTQRLQDASGVIATDELGDQLIAIGSGSPVAGAGYAKGCIYINSAGDAANTHIYVNLGTADSSTFTALTIS